MSIAFIYNLQSLRMRWRSTVGTIICIGLVVAVFLLVMALAEGLRNAYSETGDARNLLLFRKGALAESSSQITLDEIRRAQNVPGIAPGADGKPLASPEMIILITLPRAREGKAHVQVRGISPAGLELRPQVTLIAGRMFQSGVRECIVSRTLAARFPDCALGHEFRTGKNQWRVVGLFDAHKSAYDSEVWMDVDEAREAFRRAFYSSVLVRHAPGSGAQVQWQIESDRALHLRAIPERAYFAEQTKIGRPIQILGYCLAALMSIGASFAAMNNFYASIDGRSAEIATLRVLGFSSGQIYAGLIFECLVVAGAGGVLGCILALPLNGLATGTFNWASFAEVAFEFRITGSLLTDALMFALLIGLAGGALPARGAVRRPLLEALRGN